MAGKFVTFEGKDSKHYFALKAGNGETILSSQGYAAKTSCANGIDSVKRNAGDKDNFEMKTAADGRFYFVLRAGNAQPIGKSQMYKSESGCKNGVESVMKNAGDAKVVERED